MYALDSYFGVVARVVVEPVETSSHCVGGWGSPRGRRCAELVEAWRGCLRACWRRHLRRNLPHPVLPQMRLGNVEFGEGDCEVGMNILINAPVEVVLPPFSSRCSLRGVNGGS